MARYLVHIGVEGYSMVSKATMRGLGIPGARCANREPQQAEKVRSGGSVSGVGPVHSSVEAGNDRGAKGPATVRKAEGKR